MGPALTTSGGSSGPMTAYIRPSPVATATGEGGGAAADVAQETMVRMCPVTPPRRHKPVIPRSRAAWRWTLL